MAEAPRSTAHLQLALIAAIFFGPLLLAAWMYYGGHFKPAQTGSNHGTLLEPYINLDDTVPGHRLKPHNEGHWVLLYRNTGACEDDCEYALYTMRQARLMLGRDQSRLRRVFLHGDTAPDTVLVEDEHAGLITLQDRRLGDALQNKKPGALASGGYYLIDPFGNLVMYFRPEIDPSDMVEDIEHLLRLSRIG